MDFKTFQSNCKYAKYGPKEDTVRDFELTCGKSECIPQGQPWGKCDALHCPYFGIEISNIKMIDSMTGEVLYTFKGGEFTLKE